MSFVRTNRNISAAVSTGYTAEQLFGVVIDLIRDIYDEAGVKKASALPVSEKKKLLTTMHSLSKVIVDVYTQNRDGLSEFVDEEFQEEISQRAEAIMKQEAELASIAGEIAAEEEKQSRLNAILEKTVSRRGHLLNVKEECDAIQTRIDQMNDAALDAMAAKKIAMEAELASRQKRADVLALEHASIQSSLDKLEEKLNGLNNTLVAIRKRHEELKAEEASTTEETTRMEESIRTVQIKLEKAKQRIGDFPAFSERINSEYQEIQMQMTVMLNALSSARSDAFLTGNLFSHSGGITLAPETEPDRAIAEKRFNNWDEMETWFAELEKRINDLLAVFSLTLKAMVNQAESITAPQDEK